MLKIKWIMSGTLAGFLLMTAGTLAFAEEKDEKDLSAYQWGYWDKMVSPAAGPVAPAGVTISSALPSPPQPTPDPIPPTPDPIPPTPDPVPERPLIKKATPPFSPGPGGGVSSPVF